MTYRPDHVPVLRRARTPPVTSRSFFGALHDAAAHAPHRHDEDQLYWSPDGAITVSASGQRWVVRSTAAFWFPAGLVHSVEPMGAGPTLSIYSGVRLRPKGEEWQRPRAITCSPLMAEIIRHTATAELTAATRAACRELLADELKRADELHASLVMPLHPGARSAAERLLRNPQLDDTLADFARAAGVSARTLMRAFLVETGYGFAQWRTQARLISSLPLLAEGEPVHRIAELVGYRTTSGYIDAFRDAYGSTPAAYARARSR